VLLATLSVALVLQGYARHGIGRPSTESVDSSPAVPEMRDVGPILDLSGPSIR
jgi:hypothetical protein